MFKFMILPFFLLLASPAFSHHAKCIYSRDGLMTCGAHSGPVSFNLLHYGDVTKSTKQLFLCNNKSADIESITFEWVESEDENIHFKMDGAKFERVSPQCIILGGLNFTPHPNFEEAPQNAWKLTIKMKGLSIPSSLYVEAK